MKVLAHRWGICHEINALKILNGWQAGTNVISTLNKHGKTKKKVTKIGLNESDQV